MPNTTRPLTPSQPTTQRGILKVGTLPQQATGPALLVMWQHALYRLRSCTAGLHTCNLKCANTAHGACPGDAAGGAVKPGAHDEQDADSQFTFKTFDVLQMLRRAKPLLASQGFEFDEPEESTLNAKVE